jgi:SAM-dependent methyltransferase
MDISTNMISAYKTRVDDSVLPSTCTAIVGNLLDEKPYIISPSTGAEDYEFSKDDKFNDFDVCIVGLGFHHFERHVDALRELGKRVKKGGVVGIVDLFPSQKVSPLLSSSDVSLPSVRYCPSAVSSFECFPVNLKNLTKPHSTKTHWTMKCAP